VTSRVILLQRGAVPRRKLEEQKMQYMIAFYEPDADFAARDGDDSDAFWPPWRAYFGALREAGVNVGGAPLQAPRSAVTVRNEAGGRIVHDGPYADTKEQLGGFVIVEVPSLDDALAWAQRAPSAKSGAVEVRPVWPAVSEEAAAMARVGTEGASHVLAIYESSADFAHREGPDAQRYWGGWAGFSKVLAEAGVVRGGAPLCGPETATVIRIGKDGPIVHDGPYADTKEQLGGYLLVDVPSLDDALSWAARCPATLRGAVEVRPVLSVAARV